MAESANPQALLDRALELHRTGRRAEAVETYRQVVEQAPHLSSAWVNLAMLLTNAGEREAALDAFHSFLKVAGPHDTHFTALAEAELRAAGRVPPARRALSGDDPDTVALKVVKGDLTTVVFATNDAGVSPEALQDTIRKFTNAYTWADAYLVLEAHPELLSQFAQLLLKLESEGEETANAQIARVNLRVLEHCIESGADAAFAEVQGMAITDFSALIGAIREIQPALMFATQAETADDLVTRLRARPDVLQHPSTDLLLAYLWQEGPPTGRADIDELRSHLARARVGDRPPAENYEDDALLELVERADVTRSVADLTQAMHALREADSRLAHDSRDRVRYLVGLGGVLLRVFETHGGAEHLSEAEELLRRSLALEGAYSLRTPAIDGQLGAILLRVAEWTGDPAPLDESISVLERAVRYTREDARELIGRQLNLVQALVLQGERGDQAAVDRAISLAQDMANRLDAANPLMAAALLALGRAHRVVYDWSDQEDHLRDAMGAYRRVIQLPASGPYSRAQAKASLAVLLRRTGEATANAAELDDAAELLEAALDAFAENSVDAAFYTASLGSVLAARGYLSGQISDIRRAIDRYRAALASATLPARVRGEATANLGTALVWLAVETNDAESRDEGLRLLGRAVGAPTPLSDPGHVLRVCGGVGTTLARAGDFELAAAVLQRATEALDMADSLSRGSANRPRLAVSGSATVNLAAYAQACAGDVESAVVTLERHRARLMRDALDIDALELDQLAAEGHPGLARTYSRVTSELVQRQRAEQSAVGEGNPQHLRRLREHRDELLAEIRALPGHTKYALPPDMGVVLEAAKEAPLVYGCVTELGSMLLIAGSGDRDVHPVPLPALTQADVEAHTIPYLRALDAFCAAPQVPELERRFGIALTEVSNWLGQTLLDPVGEALAHSGATHAVLLLPGRLGLLPTTDTRVPHSHRWGQAVTWSSAPSAVALARATDTAQGSPMNTILVVANPQPTTAAPIESAHVEAGSAVEPFGHATVLATTLATRQRTLDALPNCNAAHFACHAHSEPNAPLDSHLVLASDEQVTLRDLLRLRLWKMRLCFLSACTSGSIGRVTPDEVVGLPAGLMEAGAAGVIGSLWPVWDAAASVLSTKFYALWPTHQESPAIALQQAQRWVRTATHNDVIELLSEHTDSAISGATVKQLAALAPTDTPFSDPIDWASFVYVGA